MRLSTLLHSTAIAALSAAIAMAGTITPYQGIDNNVGPASPRPNSDAAAAQFRAAQFPGGYQTLTFENVPLGIANAPISLGSGVVLSVSGARIISPNATAVTSDLAGIGGAFNTTPGGSNYFLLITPYVAYQQSATALATFAFPSPIHAFGAYITGLCCEAFAQVPLQFDYQFDDGSAQTIPLHGPESSSPTAVGFYGFADTDPFSSVTLAMKVSNNDPASVPGNYIWYSYIGVDDITAAPEPGSFVLFASGALGLALARAAWRRRLAASSSGK
jgi:hypothetical protein